MTSSDTITYICQVCGYENIWTRKEILQRGTKVIYKDGTYKENYFSLPCKKQGNPPCPGRRIIAVPVREE